MTQYISKSPLVEEINRIKGYYERLQALKQVYDSHIEDCNYLLSFLDTLEVEEDYKRNKEQTYKESEDKSIKNEIILYIGAKDDIFLNTHNRWLSWLEKQGEQKSDDKVEPKFKVGDWIVTPANKVFQITSIEGTSYRFDNESHYWEICYCDEQCRLWTIQDAKDGDVIYSRHNTESFEWIGIFKSSDKENKRAFFYGFWHVMSQSFIVCSNEAYVLYDDFSPATKEQRNLLFQKMHYAGYEWDAEKKELIKIEQNPAWSEDDARMLNEVILDLKVLKDKDSGEAGKAAYQREIDWLKSLKDRYTWKPSIAQINALSIVSKGNAPDDIEAIVSLYQDLKKLREE